MQWTILADVVKALAAGLTAVIATLKFIRELRRKGEPSAPDEPEIQLNTFNDNTEEEKSNQ
jgi:hypothetical protein